MNAIPLVQLSEVLPLSTPLSVLIDVSSVCNFRCSFCPTGDNKLIKSVGRPSGIMTFELFTKIINDLLEFNDKIKKILLYKDGEPFLNKNLGKMIAYAKSKEIAHSIETTSNGSLIDKERAIEIIESGLDAIRISVEHVNNKGYKKITKKFSDFGTIIKNVEFLYREKNRRKSLLKIIVKILDTNLTNDDKRMFFKIFKGISDYVSIDSLMGWSNSAIKDFTLGEKVTSGMNGQTALRNLLVCPNPFKSMAINFNGLVSVCCVDWSFGCIIGDARNESVAEVWTGDKLYHFRMLHLKGQRSKIKVCSDCHYIKGINKINNIDNNRGKLILKYARD